MGNTKKTYADLVSRLSGGQVTDENRVKELQNQYGADIEGLHKELGSTLQIKDKNRIAEVYELPSSSEEVTPQQIQPQPEQSGFSKLSDLQGKEAELSNQAQQGRDIIAERANFDIGQQNKVQEQAGFESDATRVAPPVIDHGELGGVGAKVEDLDAQREDVLSQVDKQKKVNKKESGYVSELHQTLNQGLDNIDKLISDRNNQTDYFAKQDPARILDEEQLGRAVGDLEDSEALFDLKNVRSLYKEAIQLEKAPQSDDTKFKNILKGLGDSGAVKRVATMGLSEITQNFNIADAFEKTQNGTATEEEQALVDAYTMLTAMQSNTDVSSWYSGGEQAGMMADFLATFAVTGGAGTAAKAGVRKLLGNSIKAKVAGSLAKAGTQAALSQNLVFQGVSERMKPKVSGYDGGVPVLEAGEQLSDVYLSELYSTFSEYLPEAIGAAGTRMFKQGFANVVSNRIAANPQMASDMLTKMSGRLGRATNITKAAGSTFGVQSMPVEIGEELITGAMQGNLNELLDEENFRNMVLNIAMLSGSVGTASTASRLKTNRTYQRTQGAFNNIKNDQFRNAVDQIVSYSSNTDDALKSVGQAAKLTNASESEIKIASLYAVRDAQKKQADITMQAQTKARIKQAQNSTGGLTKAIIDGETVYIKNTEDIGSGKKIIEGINLDGTPVFLSQGQINKAANEGNLQDWTIEQVQANFNNMRKLEEEAEEAKQQITNQANSKGITIGSVAKTPFGDITVAAINPDGTIVGVDKSGKEVSAPLDQSERLLTDKEKKADDAARTEHQNQIQEEVAAEDIAAFEAIIKRNGDKQQKINEINDQIAIIEEGIADMLVIQNKDESDLDVVNERLKIEILNERVNTIESMTPAQMMEAVEKSKPKKAAEEQSQNKQDDKAKTEEGSVNDQPKTIDETAPPADQYSQMKESLGKEEAFDTANEHMQDLMDELQALKAKTPKGLANKIEHKKKITELTQSIEQWGEAVNNATKEVVEETQEVTPELTEEVVVDEKAEQKKKAEINEQRRSREESIRVDGILNENMTPEIAQILDEGLTDKLSEGDYLKMKIWAEDVITNLEGRNTPEAEAQAEKMYDVLEVLDGETRFKVSETSEKTDEEFSAIIDVINEAESEIGIPSVTVTSESDLPPAVLARMKQRGIRFDSVKGFVHNGKVYISPAAAENAADARETYVHEVVGHYGVKALLTNDDIVKGEDYILTMNDVYNGMTEDQKKAYTDRKVNPLTDPTEIADEYVADTAMSENTPSWFKTVIAEARRLLNHFYGTNFSSDDVQALIARSRRNLKAGVNDADGTQFRVDPIKDEETRLRVIGEIGAARLDAVEESAVRVDNLSIAREMETAGKDAKTVKAATGWERGSDGKWRYETKDIQLADNLYLGDGVSMEYLVEDEELFEAYPELKNIHVIEGMGGDSYFTPSHPDFNNMPIISISSSDFIDTYEADEAEEFNITEKREDKIKSTLTHEIQHAIQRAEGFSRGGSLNLISKLRSEISERIEYTNSKMSTLAKRMDGLPSDSKVRQRIKEEYDELMQEKMDLPYVSDVYNAYRALGGETEARNASKRINMTPEERRNSLLEETEDVARKDQLHIVDGVLSKFPEATDEQVRFRTEEQSQIIKDAKSYDSYEEFIDAYQDKDFRDMHSAPGDQGSTSTLEERMDEGSDFNLTEVAQGYSVQPDDYFDPRNGARWYGYNDYEGQQSYRAIREAMDKIQEQTMDGDEISDIPTITAYRAVPNSVETEQLNDRDWITFSEQYAINHGESRFGDGEYKLIVEDIPADKAWWDGNDINEWGYDTGETEVLWRGDLKRIWEEANAKKNNDIRFRADKNLAALHNINEANLNKALDGKGLIAPSIAVTNFNNPYTDFGDITLVAPKDMVDPQKGDVKVFAGDVYSPTIPRPKYYVDEKALESFAANITGKAYRKYRDIGNIVENELADFGTFNKDLRSKSSENVLKNTTGSLGMKLAYLVDNNIDFRLPQKPKPAYLGFNTQANLTESEVSKAKAINAKIKEEEKIGHISQETVDLYNNFIKDILTREIDDSYSDVENADARAIFVNDAIERMYDHLKDRVSMTMYKLQPAIYGETMLDNDALKKRVDNKISKKAYKEWVSDKIDEFQGTKYFESGNKKIPYTNENLLESIIGATRGQEKLLTYGMNKAKSFGLKEFKDIPSMQNLRDVLIPKDEMSEIDEAYKAEYSLLADKLKYNSNDGWKRMDDMGKALADHYKGMSPLKALTKNGFSNNAWVDDFKDFAKRLKNNPVDYFEAKMQKIVPISEFNTAIVPQGTSKNTIDKLKTNGINVKRYNPDVEGDRAKKLQSASKKADIRFRVAESQEELDDFVKDSEYKDDAYHATDSKFTSFIPNNAQGWGNGVYLSDNKAQVADEFGDNVYTTKLNIKKPFNGNYLSIEDNIRSTNAWKSFENQLWDEAVEKGWQYKEDREEFDPDFREEIEENISVLNSAIRELGYDAIIAEDSNNIEGKEIVVFNDNQILISSIEESPRFRVAESQQELDDFVKDSEVKENLYHGTPKEGLEDFDLDQASRNSGNFGHYGNGVYFSRAKRESKTYGDNIITAKVNIKKPFTCSKEQWDELYDAGLSLLPKKKDLSYTREALWYNIKKVDPVAAKLFLLIDEKGYTDGWKEFLKENNTEDSKIDLNIIGDIHEEYEKNEGIGDNLNNDLESIGIDISKLETNVGFGYLPPLHYLTELGDYSKTKEFTDAIKDLGYDGVFYGTEVVAFSNDQILIEPTEGNAPDGDGPRFRVAETEQETSDFVEDSQFTQDFYHNSPNSFTDFDPSRFGSETDAGWLGAGFYFAFDEDAADGYGDVQYKVKLDVKNPYYLSEAEYAELQDADFDKAAAFTDEIEAKGHDAVVFDGTEFGAEIMVLDNDQILITPESDVAQEMRFRVGEDQTETPEFKEWFGDSKVVDENDEPLVVYHGAEYGGFNVFDGSRRGNWFAKNREMAVSYSNKYIEDWEDSYLYDNSEEGERYFNSLMSQRRVFDVFLSIKNPANFTGINMSEFYTNSEFVEKSGVELKIEDIESPKQHLGWEIWERNYENIVKQLEKLGFDGIHSTETTGPNGMIVSETFVPFFSNQIKSATGNDGSFSKENDDIRFRTADEVSPSDRLLDLKEDFKAGDVTIDEAKQKARSAIEDFMLDRDGKDAGKFAIEKAKTPQQVVEAIDKVEQNYAERRTKVVRDHYSTRADKLIRATKNTPKDTKIKTVYDENGKKIQSRRVTTRSEGKYDYSSNKLFTDLREINKMSKAEAQEAVNKYQEDGLTYEEKYLEELNKKDENHDSYSALTPTEESIKHLMTSVKAAGANVSIPLVIKLNKDLDFLLQEANNAKSEEEFQAAINKNNDVVMIVDGMSDTRTPEQLSTKAISAVYSAAATYDSMLKLMGGEKLHSELNLIQEEMKQSINNHQDMETLHKEIANAYGLTGSKKSRMREVQDILAKNSKLDYDVRVNAEGYKSEKISKLDIMSMYNAMKNEGIASDWIDWYGEDQINGLLSNLSDGDKLAADALMGFVGDYYNRINAVYSHFFNRDMPRVEPYWMSKAEFTKGVDVFLNQMNQAKHPTATGKRDKRRMPKFGNAYSQSIQYMQDANYYSNVSLKLDRIKRAFSDVKAKKAIENTYGKPFYKNLMNSIENSGLAKIRQDATAAEKTMMDLYGNWVTAKIGANPQVFVKQLLSAANYAENMPTGEWMKGFTKSILDPNTFNWMWERSPMMRARFENGYDEIMQIVRHANALSPKSATAQTKVKNFLTSFTRAGDILAIAYGGKSYVDHLMKQGLSEGEAIRRFEINTQPAQQSHLASLRGQAQHNNNVFAKMLFSFANTPSQYARKMMDAAAVYSKSDKTKADKAKLRKTMTLYAGYNAAAYTITSQLLGRLFYGNGSDDDELLKNTISKVMSTPFGAVPLGQAGAETALKLAMGQKPYDISVPVIDDFNRMIGAVASDNYGEAAKHGAELMAGLPIKTYEKLLKGSGLLGESRSQVVASNNYDSYNTRYNRMVKDIKSKKYDNKDLIGRYDDLYKKRGILGGLKKQISKNKSVMKKAKETGNKDLVKKSQERIKNLQIKFVETYKNLE